MDSVIRVPSKRSEARVHTGTVACLHTVTPPRLQTINMPRQLIINWVMNINWVMGIMWVTNGDLLCLTVVRLSVMCPCAML